MIFTATFVIIWISMLYLLKKQADKLSDSKRIYDFLAVGSLLMFAGIFLNDTSIQRAGQIMFGYGYLLLLYQSFRTGLKEGSENAKL